MAWKKEYESHPVFIGTAIFLMTFVQLLFVVEEGGGWFFNPAFGVAFVFVYMFGKKSYLGILPGLFLGQFFIRTFVFEFPLDLTLLSAFFMTLTLFLQTEVLLKLTKEFRLTRLVEKEHLKALFLFGVIGLLVSLVGAYLHLLTVILNIGYCEMSRCYWLIAYGEFMGLMILVPSGVFSYRLDADLFRHRKLKEVSLRILFTASYIIMLLVLAFDLDFFDYLSHAYILAIFFILIGFLFTYRLIHYFVLLYLLVGRFVYLPQIPEEDVALTMASMVFFSGIMIYLSLLIKRYLDLKLSLTREILDKTTIQDSLLTDVYQLLYVSEDILNQDDPDQSIFLKQSFTISHQLFKDVDASYSYIEDQGAIKLVDTFNYQEDRVPYLYESHQLLEERNNDFAVFDYLPKVIRTMYGEKYGLFDDDYHSVKSRIMMRWMISPTMRFVVVIDRFENRSLFSQVQKKRVAQFRDLMDGLYKRNYYTKHYKNIKEEIVLALVRTLELYDAYTKGHSEDVAFFSVSIANKLQLDEDFKRTIYWAGILHDIGKVGIDEAILNKKGTLTHHEYQAVKDHSEYGFEIIKDSSHLETIALFVRHHHEWWDGKGYPDQLKGEDIPYGSRIISVADMVSTMATDRPYRKKQSKEQILDELKRCRGGQFAEDITDVMIELIEEGILEQRYS